MADKIISAIGVPAGAIASTDLVEGEVSGVSAKLTLAQVFTAGKNAASEGTSGAVELATLAEVTTGTSTSTAVTPEGVKQQTDLLVTKDTLHANTVMIATSDHTPTELAVAASRIVGRKASGNIVALTAAELMAIIGTSPHIVGSDADGDTWYRASGVLARLGIGTALQYFRVNAGGTAPEWVTSTPGTGHLIQVQHAVLNSVVECSTVMPCDDTIPQKTEGTEVITCAITPQDAANVLLIQASICMNYSLTTYQGGMALFQDTTAGALAAVKASAWVYSPPNILIYKKVAGGVAATTFKIRVGPMAAGTMYVNSQYDAATRIFGGVSASTLTIFEYTP
jgi:hypothetical protein